MQTIIINIFTSILLSNTPKCRFCYTGPMIPLQPTLDIRSYQPHAHIHQHDYHQLVLPVAGQLQMQVGHREGLVSNQQIALIAAGEDHGFHADGHNRFIVADIPDRLAPQLARLPAFMPLDPVLSQYIHFLHLQLSLPGSAQLDSQPQMLQLLLQLLHERTGEPRQLDPRIAAARHYLDQHYAQSISLATLARVASLSPRQLSELFHRQFAMTPQQYQTDKRMRHAHQLLCNTTLSVQRIADQVGYQSLAAFSNRFRKHFGQPPRNVRQIDKQPRQISKDGTR